MTLEHILFFLRVYTSFDILQNTIEISYRDLTHRFLSFSAHYCAVLVLQKLNNFDFSQ